MLVGCTLDQPEVDAIAKGAECRAQVKAHLLANPLKPAQSKRSPSARIAGLDGRQRSLEVQVAVPCDEHRRPIPAQGIFHEKAGIIEDKTGDRLAFNGSLNETEAGWTQNWESLNIFRCWRRPRASPPRKPTSPNSGLASPSTSSPCRCPDALRDDLLRFLPENDLPARLKTRARPPIRSAARAPSPPPPAEPSSICGARLGLHQATHPKCPTAANASAKPPPTSTLAPPDSRFPAPLR